MIIAVIVASEGRDMTKGPTPNHTKFSVVAAAIRAMG